ncbi:ribulokinase [Seonamhaeicola sp.]|uniref:ribulokinase n=1 Tax=Seonamhaeicola sp. TaxID=1912245 RepID=UPI0026094043|nr:ribulokinase [Seonamhaeicola sp.]
MEAQYVIGLDFGTDSVRSLLVDTNSGKSLGSAVHWYQRWKQGLYCNPSKNQYRQHTLDHMEGMEKVIKQVIEDTGVSPGAIKGICVDTTGSSPQAIDNHGTPLCLKAEFAENPNAMMVLWKDHTAIKEAEEINRVVKSLNCNYLKFVGGIYSSEWFWAKILHISRIDESIKKAAFTWMEHCDLMTYLLVGSPPLSKFKYSRCAAGHKALWHLDWGGLPQNVFLNTLDPYLAEIKNNLYNHTFTSDEVAGNLCEGWADKLGLSTDTIVAVGTFDAHAGAVGAAVKENCLVRVMGTSTCDIAVCKKEVIGKKAIRGICGQVDGSVIPGMIGLEAGQSAFGDLLAWFKNMLVAPTKAIIETSDVLNSSQKENLLIALEKDLIGTLSQHAALLPVKETAVVALDWINGRRTPDANQGLKSAIMNLSLGSEASHIFKALVEAICFGAKKIIERFQEEGIEIHTIIGIGGVADKSPFVMQTLANVLNMPIKVSASNQTPALGAAMYASVAAGIHETVEKAIANMGQGFKTSYMPENEKVKVYEKLYKDYEILAGFVESHV